MSLNIQANSVMPQNNVAFKGKEKFLQKVKRNILFSPEQQQRVREIMQANITKDQKRVLLTNMYAPKNYTPQPIKSYFTNIINNLKRIFSK